MNKRGFTVVELVTTVSIISVVALLLIRLTISLKELYIDSDIKTSLITKQSTLTEKIYHDLNNEVLTDITNCTEQNCNYINFVYKSGTKKLEIDSNNKTVTYDNYTYKLLSSSSFGEFNLTQTEDIVTISLPIYNKLVEGNYGLNITFTSELVLNTSVLVIDTSSS